MEKITQRIKNHLYRNLPRKFKFIGRPSQPLPWWIVVVDAPDGDTDIVAGIVLFPFTHWDVYFDFLIYGEDFEY